MYWSTLFEFRQKYLIFEFWRQKSPLYPFDFKTAIVAIFGAKIQIHEKKKKNWK